MPAAVNPHRGYDSPRRREQAAETRRKILDAAEELFARDGYAAIAMPAVADRAGVALKTVYLAFGTKAGVLHGAVGRPPRRGRPAPRTRTSNGSGTRSARNCSALPGPAGRAKRLEAPRHRGPSAACPAHVLISCYRYV